DEECHDLFSDLIDPVICEVLNINEINGLEINLNWKEIQGGNLNAATSRHQSNTASLPWMPLPASTQDSLQPQLSRDMPRGRFIWITADQQCRIFVNYFDHLKLNVTQPGGNSTSLKHLEDTATCMEESLKQTGQRFAWTLKYGFLSCSPENIGTGLEDPRFKRIIHVLPVKSEHGDESQGNDVICISNKHKLSFFDIYYCCLKVEVVQQVINSVMLLLELDKR
ncbi:unnamed protein product, partial [Porites evermanni]